MKRCLALTFVGILLTSGVPMSHAAELKVGDKAPEFSLTGSDGKTYALADFKGKQAVVIAWYPKAFTGGCTKECKSFRENGTAIRKFNVAYFTASCDSVEKNTEFAKSLDVDYPILSDPEKTVAKAYGVVHEGREVPERWTFIIGADGNILHIDREVKAASHGEDLVKQLAELKVPEKKG
ncbi:MAG: peroxiredoxin [Planctomycetaceae bacterium]